MINTKPYNLRIGLTEAALTNFYLHKISVPDTIEYKGFASLVPQGDGGKSRQGYSSVVLTWANANAITAYRVRKFVDDALLGTRSLFLTIPYNDGSVRGRTFIDVSGVPIPISPVEAGNAADWGIVFKGIQLTVNNLTIVNNPSTV